MEFCMGTNEMSGVQKTNRLIMVEWLTTLGTLIGCFAFLLHRVDNQSERTDKLYEIYCEESKRQDARTDKLYEMFIDLVKENKS